MKIEGKSLEILASLKKELIEEDKKRYLEYQKQIESNLLEKYSKYGFTNRYDLIEYLFNDNIICTIDDYSNYFKLSEDKTFVIHHSMQYNDIDLPIGYSNRNMSLQEFIDWTKWMDNEENKFYGYIEYWIKNYE